MMNRRAFLAWLGGAAAGVAAAPLLDLDKLLWTPGEKTIFIPPPPTLTTPVGLTKGDIFTIDGVFATNPITGRSTQVLQRFIITSDVNAGSVTVNIARDIQRGSTARPLGTYPKWHHVASRFSLQ